MNYIFEWFEITINVNTCFWFHFPEAANSPKLKNICQYYSPRIVHHFPWHTMIYIFSHLHLQRITEDKIQQHTCIQELFCSFSVRAFDPLSMVRVLFSNVDKHCSNWKQNTRPNSKQCGKFSLFMPAGGFCLVLFVVITAAHIAPIYDDAGCEVAASCCSGLIEMVHGVSTPSLQTDFSHSSFPFYSLMPAVLMSLDRSSESFGEINSSLHILWKLGYRTGGIRLSLLRLRTR